MHVHNASHFSARVIEHIPHSDKSKKMMFSNVEYMQTTIKLQEYYRSIKNRYAWRWIIYDSFYIILFVNLHIIQEIAF